MELHWNFYGQQSLTLPTEHEYVTQYRAAMGLDAVPTPTERADLDTKGDEIMTSQTMSKDARRLSAEVLDHSKDLVEIGGREAPVTYQKLVE